MRYISFFEDLRLTDVPTVGGKNASLGELTQVLRESDVLVSPGFAITAHAYWHYLEYNTLVAELKKVRGQLVDVFNLEELAACAHQMRKLIANGQLPEDLKQEIAYSYKKLSEQMGVVEVDVAVRSSATAEDLPTASFAGQQETYLHIQGVEALFDACRKSFASLFTDRAIAYRAEQGFDDFEVGLSIGVQVMVQADDATSGVIFTLDTETGFPDVVTVTAAYGLGEGIVQGVVSPDVYLVHKPTFEKGYASLIGKTVSNKLEKITRDGTVSVPVTLQKKYALDDQAIFMLVRASLLVEQHYSQLAGQWKPMDIEWAQDSVTKKFYILQARPETVHSQKKQTYEQCVLDTKVEKKVRVHGQSIGQKIVHGTVRVVLKREDLRELLPTDILVTEMTDPDWVPALKNARGLITDKGGRTCHAAIVSRELGIPAIVGTGNATMMLRDGEKITLDCSQGSQGYVYEGEVTFTCTTFEQKQSWTDGDVCGTSLMVNCASPETAFLNAQLPVSGVGLARLEFIIAHTIKVHPMVAAEFQKIRDEEIKRTVLQLSEGYLSVKDYYVKTLARSVAMIVAAFYPRPVIVRLTDFKSNEYRSLLGGSLYEPHEENPMLGFRGAARYASASYAPAFALECAALKMVREVFGLINMKIMVPFVRTLEEAKKTIALLAEHGLKQGEDGLELYMMVEIPSNVILLRDFAYLFDGFSIGSNDLTQLVLGVDRDGVRAGDYDERDQAVLEMLKLAIHRAREMGKPIGICGQAPSDFPEIAQFLIDEGITSLSLNPDSVMPFLMRCKK